MIMNWNEYRQMTADLLKNGYIPVFGEFCPELEEIISEAIFSAQKKGMREVTLLINSDGGRHDCFNGIKAAMMISGLRFIGLVTSRARSNGFRLLQHCHERMAIPNATLMFHWGNSRLENTDIAALMEKDMSPVEHIIAVRKATLNEVHRRTGIPKRKLKRYADRESYFLATQALKLNMLDKIISDLPPDATVSTP